MALYIPAYHQSNVLVSGGSVPIRLFEFRRFSNIEHPERYGHAEFTSQGWLNYLSVHLSCIIFFSYWNWQSAEFNVKYKGCKLFRAQSWYRAYIHFIQFDYSISKWWQYRYSSKRGWFFSFQEDSFNYVH